MLENLIKLDQAVREYGLVWRDAKMILDQIQSEILEVREAIDFNHPVSQVHSEMGDLLHAVLSLILFCNCDIAVIINGICEKFSERMSYVKMLATEAGLENLKGLPDEVLMDFWRKAKILQEREKKDVSESMMDLDL